MLPLLMSELRDDFLAHDERWKAICGRILLIRVHWCLPTFTEVQVIHHAKLRDAALVWCLLRHGNFCGPTAA